MKKSIRTLGIALVVLMGASSAVAHNPIVINGGPTNADTANVIEDISLSQVGYHEATAASPTMWFQLEGQVEQTLSVELGVPYINRYAGLRPAAVLLGPGLPPLDLPFDVPDGLGGIVFTSEGLAPEVFDEEFTGTISWIWPAQEYVFETAGTYYLVGYIPSGEDGKFWVAVGKTEAFGLSDIIRLPQVLSSVRSFHEIGPFGGILFWIMIAIIGLLVALLGLAARSLFFLAA